jgi:hypothetical protein
LEKDRLGDGVYGIYGGDGGVGCVLTAANKVYLGRAVVTSDCEGCGEGYTGCAADWDVLVVERCFSVGSLLSEQGGLGGSIENMWNVGTGRTY